MSKAKVTAKTAVKGAIKKPDRKKNIVPNKEKE